jgi:Zn-dependent protease/predicted transcriptional regulator
MEDAEMKWSWRIGTFAGIGVYVHATFILLLGWIALSHWMQYQSLIPTLAGVAFILALFLCVVLHEYGHALTARQFGIATKDITLLPIGGLARLERMPDKPNHELWVALAGPAVNVALAVMLGVYLLVIGHFEPVNQISLTHGDFVERLLFANLFLAGFNLIPAFPMDGGRVLRALLAKRMEYVRATRIAAGIGQGLAFVFGFVGLFTNPFLVFIAFFVWIGAAQEALTAQTKLALGSASAKDAMITNFEILSPSDEISKAVKLMLDGSQQDFPVVEQGHVKGMLVRGDVLASLAKGEVFANVRNVMREHFSIAAPDEALQSLFMRLYETEATTLPVVEGDRLVGLITRENMAEYMMVRTALTEAEKYNGGDHPNAGFLAINRRVLG